MLHIRRYNELGHADYGWLNAHYHFSFADYHDPRHTQHGVLRVINDDIVAPHSGFDFHGHRDMEIITYVRQGAISHEDNLGNKGRTQAGNVQVMSAGTGILHAEWNRENEATKLYQIWIHPKSRGIKPRWEAKAFPTAPVKDTLPILASGLPEHAGQALYIHQDAVLAGGRLSQGTRLSHPLRGLGYLLVSHGSVALEGALLNAGDGAAISEVNSLTITAQSDAEIVIIDVPAA